MDDREKVQDESEEELQMSSTDEDAAFAAAEPFEGGGAETPEADPPIIITGSGT